MNKTCGECHYFTRSNNYDMCAMYADFREESDSRLCEYFTQKVITNGDKIRQGGDDELINFADGIRRRMCHYCVYSKDKTCVDKTGDCWEGVRAWLNAPAESEGK